MQHRGKIIETAVRNSGLSISKLCQMLGKSRRWMYLIFENEKVPLDYIFKIGQLIKYDFSNELNELNYLSNQKGFEEEIPAHIEHFLYWKIKYYQLLEEYYELSKKASKRKV